MKSDSDLEMWVIYDHPKDFPDCFVARKTVVNSGPEYPRPTAVCKTAPTLEDLREKLPPGLSMLSRSPDDDPVIVEIWF